MITILAEVRLKDEATHLSTQLYQFLYSSTQPLVPLLSNTFLYLPTHPSDFAIHPYTQPLIPLLIHPYLYLATHPSPKPPIPSTQPPSTQSPSTYSPSSHPSFQLATHPPTDPSTQTPSTLLGHPYCYSATHHFTQPPIPLLSHPFLHLATHPSPQPFVPRSDMFFNSNFFCCYKVIIVPLIHSNFISCFFFLYANICVIF